MKKTIRLTESDLVKLVNKVIKEQSSINFKTIDDNANRELNNRNADIFVYPNTSQRFTQVTILNAATPQDTFGRNTKNPFSNLGGFIASPEIELTVRDNSFIDNYGRQLAVQPKQNKVEKILFTCENRDRLFLGNNKQGYFEDNAYNRTIQGKLTEILGCKAPINRKTDFTASAKSSDDTPNLG
jgi:hypothetical protein